MLTRLVKLSVQHLVCKCCCHHSSDDVVRLARSLHLSLSLYTLSWLNINRLLYTYLYENFVHTIAFELYFHTFTVASMSERLSVNSREPTSISHSNYTALCLKLCVTTQTYTVIFGVGIRHTVLVFTEGLTK